MNIHQVSNEVWGIGNDVLWNRFEKKDWPNILLPFILLRRLDICWQEEYGKWSKKKTTQTAVEQAFGTLRFKNDTATEIDAETGKALDYLLEISKNSPLATLPKLKQYVRGFNPEVLEIFQALNFFDWIEKLQNKDALQPLLFRICDKSRFDFTSASASPELMSEVFEDMIRQFAEQNNKEAGEHYTPRDAVELLVRLLLNGDIPQDGEEVDFYDPTCGTGGILSMGMKAIKERVAQARRTTPPIVKLFGQELMDLTYGICKADLLLRRDDWENIKVGDTLKNDLHAGRRFRYQGANPPYGVAWKMIQKQVEEEAAKGNQGRFPGGTPRVTDGQFLILQHMVSKMRSKQDGGGRIAVVLNGSPLFSGDAGSGDSNIRGWLLKNDLVEAIVRLPSELFFNTGITTYIWVLSNKKSGKRAGHVYLIDAADMGERMAKSLGNKRYILSEETIKEVAGWHQSKEENAKVMRVPNEAFAYYSVDIKVPVLDEKGEQKHELKGKKSVARFEKDTERVPFTACSAFGTGQLNEEAELQRSKALALIIESMRPDEAAAFSIEQVTIGWEIPFNQLFYKFEAPADPFELGVQLKAALKEIEI